MSPDALKSLVNPASVSSVRAYYFGKIDPLILSFEKKIPIHLVKLINPTLNGIGLLQPIIFENLAPTIVLEVRK
jgi:hypothetical protein